MSKKTIYILGMPRSGTTWLAKIIDSNEVVFYHHEPDSVAASSEIPFIPEKQYINEELINTTRAYLDKLKHVRHPKVVGSQPMFRKTYRSKLMALIHRCFVFSIKAIEKLCKKLLGRSISWQIPHCYSDKSQSVDVIKSVNSLTRAHLFSLADPSIKVVHIIRHPCAFVASELRGESLNLMKINTFVDSQARMSQAKAHGLTKERLLSLPRESQLASLWMLHNEKVMQEMEGHDNYMQVLYEELCQDPLTVTKQIFKFCGLTYSPQTEDFIQQSLGYTGQDNEKYFQVIRDPVKAATKWKSELSNTQIEAISRVVANSKPGKLYF